MPSSVGGDSIFTNKNVLRELIADFCFFVFLCVLLLAVQLWLSHRTGGDDYIIDLWDSISKNNLNHCTYN